MDDLVNAREVLLVLGLRYLPRAQAACAHALLPLARQHVAHAGDWKLKLPNCVAEAPPPSASTRSPFQMAAEALLAQPAPRATGAICRLECAGEAIYCVLATFRMKYAPSKAGGRTPRTPRTPGTPGSVGVASLPGLPPPMPPPLEPIITTLAPISVEGLLVVLTSLLLEQKVLLCSRRASRLTAAAAALTSLLFPLMWVSTLAPVLPRSHQAVLAAPFPFLLGTTPCSLPPERAASRTEKGGVPSACPHAPAPSITRTVSTHPQRPTLSDHTSTTPVLYPSSPSSPSL